MAGNYMKSMGESAACFETVVKPHVLAVLHGEILAVEGQRHAALVALDEMAGIDYLHLKGSSVRGIAGRIQFGDTNWRTFTVRKAREGGTKTEYAKRLEAMKNGDLYPAFTMQAYVSKSNQLLGLAVMRTADLYEMIDDGVARTERTGRNQDGQASFYVVRWADVLASGYAFYEYDSEKGPATYKRRRAIRLDSQADTLPEDQPVEVTDADIQRFRETGSILPARRAPWGGK